MTDWSAAEILCLKSLVAEGLSASQISAQMPGRNRNAVIGKVHRAKGALGTIGANGGARQGRGQAAAHPDAARRDGWTAAEIDRLKAMAAEQLSVPAMMLRMPARSRKAIMGKLDRLGLKAGSALPPRTSPPLVPVDLPPLPKPADPPAAPNLPALLPITFLQAVMTDRCLYFVGDPFCPDGPDMPVCGGWRAEYGGRENRYCRLHVRRMTCEAA